MNPLSEYCFWIVPASGPIASTKPMAKKQRKIGSVRSFIVSLPAVVGKGPWRPRRRAPRGRAEAMREPSHRQSRASRTSRRCYQSLARRW